MGLLNILFDAKKSPRILTELGMMPYCPECGAFDWKNRAKQAGDPGWCDSVDVCQNCGLIDPVIER